MIPSWKWAALPLGVGLVAVACSTESPPPEPVRSARQAALTIPIQQEGTLLGLVQGPGNPSNLGESLARHDSTGAGTIVAASCAGGLAIFEGGEPKDFIAGARSTQEGSLWFHSSGDLVAASGRLRNFSLVDQQWTLTYDESPPGGGSGEGLAFGADTLVTGNGDGVVHLLPRSGSGYGTATEVVVAAGEYIESVAIDGDTLLVGLSQTDVGGNVRQGAAAVLVFDGSQWNQQQLLTASDGLERAYFGQRVAVSGDWAFVGTFLPDSPGPGSVYAFERSGSTWSEHSKLQAPVPATDDYFGRRLVASGSSVTVAAPGELGGSVAGAVHAFDEQGGTWQLDESQTTLFGASPGSGFGTDFQGQVFGVPAYNWDVPFTGGAVEAEGTRLTLDKGQRGARFGFGMLEGDLAVVNSGELELGSNSDRLTARYTFQRDGLDWKLMERAWPVGTSSFDGTRLLELDAAGTTLEISTWSGSGWVVEHSAPLPPLGQNGTRFEPPHIRGDIATIRDNSGATWLLERSGGSWGAPIQLVASDGQDDFTGACTDEAGRLVMGADGVGPSSYRFEQVGGSWVGNPLPDPGFRCAFGRAIDQSIALADPNDGSALQVVSQVGETLLALSSNNDDTYVFTRSGTVWEYRGSMDLGGYAISFDGRRILVENREADELRGEAYVFRLDGLAGVDCSFDSQCADGYFCRSGICCTSSCDGSCEVCTAAEGATADGVCTPVPMGTVGEPECKGRVLCNGQAGSCPAGCSIDEECPDGTLCQFATGSCVNAKPDATPCSEGRECASGVCADGVCCATACNGQCESCAEAGSEGDCVAVEGAPRGDRNTCPEAGTICGGSCDGQKRDGCTFPGTATECAAAACASGTSSRPAGTCDGTGSCLKPLVEDCGDYLCDEATGTCGTSCESDDDCASGARCSTEGQCTAEGSRCIDTTTVRSPSGEETDCSPYTCDAGACRDTCSTSNDCASGFDCDGGRCVTPGGGSGGSSGGSGSSSGGSGAGDSGTTAKSESGCGCTTAGGQAPRGASWLLLLGMGFLMRRRRW